MPRELVVELIKRKKVIHQANQELVIEELAVEEELALCPLEKEFELDAKLREIKAKQFASKAKLDRAYFFSQRYSHGPIPTLCHACFVDHGESSSMIESTERHWTGERLFKCEKKGCGVEVHIAEVIDR